MNKRVIKIKLKKQFKKVFLARKPGQPWLALLGDRKNNQTVSWLMVAGQGVGGTVFCPRPPSPIPLSALLCCSL